MRSIMYSKESRALQDRFDTRRLADRIEERLVRDHINDEDRAFIEARDMLFLATCDRDGHPQCSYKGGDPGFVRVLDEKTIEFPSYDGNGMFLSAGNVAGNAHVGILFLDFTAGRRLRLNGEATLIDTPDQFLYRVAVREVFPNCPRYIHRYELVERSVFVPRGAKPPVPACKTREWSRDVLPAADPARDPDAEVK